MRHVQENSCAKFFLYPIYCRAQTSIGLSLGYGIVRAYGGDLHVESKREMGEHNLNEIN